MLELRGRELCDAPREKPVWVTLECSVPQAGAWVERSEPDRLLLPLSSPGEPETVIGMVSIEDFHHARALLASVGPIRIEGFALMPSAEEARDVVEALKPRGLSVASGFRILEAGKRPAGLSVAVILFASGSLVAASLAASLLASFRRRVLDVPAPVPFEVPPTPPPASPPASEAQPVVDAGGGEAPPPSRPTSPSTEPVLDMPRERKSMKHPEKPAGTPLETPLVVPVGSPADETLELLEPFEPCDVSADTVSELAFRLARAALAAGRPLPRDLSEEAKADIHTMVKEVWDSAV